MYNAAVFSVFHKVVQLPPPVLERFHHSRKQAYTHKQLLYILPFSHSPGLVTMIYFLSMYLPILGISYQWNCRKLN